MVRPYTKICDNIFVLQGKRSSNIYYLDFDKKALIDCGHPGETEKNIASLQAAGIPLSDIDYLINTHSHADHIGLCAYLKTINPGLQIISAPEKVQYQALRKCKRIFSEAEDDFNEFDIDIPVGHGDCIDMGNTSLQVIKTPGHTIDSISLYWPFNKWIFTGDILYDRVICQLDYYQDIMQSLHELEESYNRIKALEPVLVLPGHGGMLDNPTVLINQVLRKIRRFRITPHMIIINNLIPTVEFFLYKRKKMFFDDLKEYLVGYYPKLSDQTVFNDVDEIMYRELVDKTLSLMALLKIIDFKNNTISLLNEVNEYIGVKRS